MHNLKSNFDKILNITKSFYQGSIDADDNYYFYPNKPKMSDFQGRLHRICLLPGKLDCLLLFKSSQHDKERIPFIFMKSRKRIETLFSQLCDQLMLKRNYAKKTKGLSVRILCKIAAVTMLQYINYMNEKPLNHLKYALVSLQHNGLF